MQPPTLWPPLETVRQSLRQETVSIVDQDEMGNHLWHYEVTGSAMEEVLHLQQHLVL